jgi:ABC-type transport system involved in multi-copper enzyme maturation permease subunit
MADAHLLHYRPWRGSLAGGGELGVLAFVSAQLILLLILGLIPSFPLLRIALAALYVASWGLVVYSRAWPIARASIALLMRRWLFWVIFVVTAVPPFLFFFFVMYLFVWAEGQGGEEGQMGGLGVVRPEFLEAVAKGLRMDGSPETYRNFMSFEAYPVMILLALAGALLIGNDVRHNSLAFYLSKPISRWDYVIGKAVAVALIVNLATTLPALLLWLEYGFIKEKNYFLDQLVEKTDVLVGILAYGAVLTVSLTSLLLAAAIWLRRTVPLIMTWVILFVCCSSLANSLARLGWGAGWRLFDLWNCTFVVGNACLGLDSTRIVRQPQPDWPEAAVVLGGVVITCVSYLVWRIRGVEVVK